MKKSSNLLLLALCLVCVFTSFSTVSADKKEVVEFWMLPVIDEAKLNDLVSEFNAQSETTEVSLSVLAWSDGREQIKQAVAAGVGPDVFYIGAGLDNDYIQGQLLLPLDENGYSQEDIEKYSPLIATSSANGHLLAAPLSYELYILYYRTDILEQFGYDAPPATRAELKEMASKISKDSNGDIMGFQFKGADDQLNAINYSWQTLLTQNGGSLMDLDNMKSTEFSEIAVQTLEYMKSFYSEGISTLGTSANNGFREGKIAMFEFTTGPLTSEGYTTDPNMSGKWSVAALPAGEDNGGGYLGGHAVAVNAATEVSEGAVEFVKWFTSPKNATVWMKNFYGVQPYDMEKLSAEEKTAITEVMESEPEYWNAITAEAAACTPDFMIQTRYAYSARWDGQKRLIIAALTGEMSVEDALKQLDVEINQSL